MMTNQQMFESRNDPTRPGVSPEGQLDDRWGTPDWSNRPTERRLPQNVFAGARLAFFRPVDASAFRVDLNQIVLLVVLGGALQ